MKANEFIKKYGIEEAKKSLAILENSGEKDEFYVQLYELVNSHEIYNILMDSFDPEKQTALMSKIFENKRDWIGGKWDNVDLEKLK